MNKIKEVEEIKYKNVYCVCKEATKSNCGQYLKYGDIKPTHTFAHDDWEKKI